MKKLEKYSNLIIILCFLIVGIIVYKAFDNITEIMNGIGAFFEILSPFLIGFVIAYILNIPSKKIAGLCEKSKYKFVREKNKGISILSVYLLSLLLLYVVISAIVPALYQNLVELYYNIPKYVDEIISEFSVWQDENGIILFELNEKNVAATINKLLAKINLMEFSKYAKGVISITSGVINVFIGVIISVYMLIDKEKIKKSIKRVMYLFVKKDMCNNIIKVVRRTNNVFSKYFFCLIIDAVIMSLLSTLILSVLRVKYAIILGCMIGIFNLIPYFGAIFAIAIAIIVSLITGGLFQGIWVAIFLIILQQLDGNFIGPKIMGEVLDASPLLIIFAITVGGGLFGIGGMIISVPMFVVLKMIIADFINEKELEKSGK